MARLLERLQINRGLLACCAVGIACLMAAPAWAQRLSTPLTGNAVPQGSPIPRLMPPELPEVGPGLLTPPAQPNGQTPAVAVPVKQVRIEGATIYPPARLAKLTAGLVGAAVPLRAIEAARLAILNLYRQHGYVLSSVSAALGADGTLRYVVTEGHIVAVKLSGDIGPAGTQVLRFLDNLTRLPVVDAASLERWLLLAGDIPGVSVHAVLRPSPDEPGALTLIAEVSRRAVSGLLTADNYDFPLTGSEEGLAVLDLNSFTEFGEQSEVSLYGTNGLRQVFGQASEQLYAGASGLKIRLYAGTGYADPTGFLRTIGYQGLVTDGGISASYPLIRSRQQTLTLSGYLDAIEDEIRTDTGPQGQQTRASRDSLRIARVAGDYALQDLFAGTDRPAVNVLDARLSQGISALGGTTNSNPLPSRPGENVNFTKLDAEISRTQTLFYPWDGANVAFKGLLAGQISNSVLPAVEQYFLGGPNFTRGYYEGQVVGDNALVWTAELQLNTGFEATLLQRALHVGTQFYLFYDGGQVWQNTAQEPNYTLSSEGIGARFDVTQNTEIDVIGVVRNTRQPIGLPGQTTPLSGEAAYWQVVVRF